MITDTEYARRKYFGAMARDYEAERATEPKYVAENRMLPEWLGDLPAHSHVLDIPVGTGRFIPFYEQRGFCVTGLDVSHDMLALAREKITTPYVVLAYGDLVRIPLTDKSASACVCLRILNRLLPGDFRTALREMQRVTRDRIVLNLRVRNHKRAKSYEMLGQALDGWRIARDEAEVEHDQDYRMLMLVPA